MTTVDTSQWEEFTAQLKRHLNGGFTSALTAGGEMAGAQIDELARNTLPPSKISSLPAGMKALRTLKQRRWWWATMREKALGKSKALPGWKAVYKKVNGRKVLVISGHYKRTGKLMQSLTWRVISIRDGVEVQYGTNRAYGAYVIGNPNDADESRRQARIHQGNWTPLIDLIGNHLDTINQAFRAGAMAQIARDLDAEGTTT